MFNGLGPIFGTGAGSNDGDYSNPEFDQLLDEGASATEVEAGIEKFQQAQEILFEDLPAIPLWYTNASGAWGEQVENAEFGWDGWPILHQITKTETE
jgi:oligopeptide transport system substrate-binding protein